MQNTHNKTFMKEASKALDLMHRYALIAVMVTRIVRVGRLMALAFVVAVGVNAGGVPTRAAGAGFLETFDGDPPTPTSWRDVPLFRTWDITVHNRGGDVLNPVLAQHGPNCEPPMATHPVADYRDTVFQCRNHFMTAIDEPGYGVIYVTPNQIIDFSQQTAVIRFDISTVVTSERDWWDVWISPYDEHLQLTLDEIFPDLSGPPRRAVQVNLGTDTVLHAQIYENFQSVHGTGHNGDIPSIWWVGYDDLFQPMPMERKTFEVHLSKTHLKVGMPAYDFWWIDSDIPPLSWDRGIVQFGHHSYTPEKGFMPNARGNTWHWDNVSLDPVADDFQIIKASRRSIHADWPDNLLPNGDSMTFDAPAPVDSHLRFSAMGNQVQVSFDGGQTWVNAPAPNQKDGVGDGATFQSYWMPIPAGVQTVYFRAQGGWWGSEWTIRDASVWSRSGDVAPTATATVATPATNTPAVSPTAVPTATAPAPATATRTTAPTVTSTPVPTATRTVVPTSTATSVPPPTPTAVPGVPPRYRVSFDEGAGSAFTGTGITGETFSTTWVPGRSGSALAFDGVRDFADLGDVVLPTGQLGVSLWIKPDDFEVNEARLLAKAANTSSSNQIVSLSLVNQNGQARLRFRLKLNGTVYALTSGSNGIVTVGAWQHVLATFDGSLMRLYLDGQLVGQRAATGAIDAAATFTWLGSNPPAINTYQFDGAIDELMIFDVAVTPQEVP